MNTSIKTIISVISLSCLTLTNSFAEGKGNQDWAEKAALGYEKKAVAATAAGNTGDAKIYTRMAQIKRDAGAASKQGEKFSWDEYHTLAGQLSHKRGGKKHDKKHGKKSDGGFVNAVKGYDIKAAMAKELGNNADAEIYTKLANIKRMAANGKLKNWDEYHQLSSQLRGNKKHAGKHAKGKDHKGKRKPGNGFLKAAADYQMKANEAMAAGDEHNAKIYTELSNMKTEAAAFATKGKGYDWTKYFALQKELK